MYCPKCGFEQAEAPDCLRCGLVFARYHKELPTLQHAAKPQSGFSQKLFRILRWAGPALLLLAITLILRSPKLPLLVITPDAAQRAEEKIGKFRSAITHHTGRTLSLDESELNGWLEDNLARAARNAAQSEGAASSLRDVKVQLLADSLRLFAIAKVYGVDVTLELEGKIVVEKGYMRLQPVRGRMGSMPLLSAALQKAAAGIFSSPANKENFHLPPEVEDIQIAQGRLIVSSR